MFTAFLQEALRHTPTLALRTVLLYLLVLGAMRWTGKRTVTAMAPFDLALVILISEVAAIPITELDVDLAHALVPVVILALVHLLVTTLNLHNRRVEEFTEGRPTLLIQDGRILVENLRRERVSLADLSAALRREQVSHLREVEEAWLEPTGGLSVILNAEHRPLTARDLRAGSLLSTTLGRLNLARLERQVADLAARRGRRPVGGGRRVGREPQAGRETQARRERQVGRERQAPDPNQNPSASADQAARRPQEGLLPGMEPYLQMLGGPGASAAGSRNRKSP